MRSVIGLVVVAAIVLLSYKIYFSKLGTGSGATGGPTQTIDIVGVKGDLLSIAQAERIYQTQHGSYASLDDLVSSGALSMRKDGRDGYIPTAWIPPQTASAWWRSAPARSFRGAATTRWTRRWKSNRSPERTARPWGRLREFFPAMRFGWKHSPSGPRNRPPRGTGFSPDAQGAMPGRAYCCGGCCCGCGRLVTSAETPAVAFAAEL